MADAAALMTAWRSLLELDPADLGANKRLAKLFIELDRSEEAIPHLRAVTEADPGDLGAWRRLGRTLAESGAPADEIDVLRRRLELGDDDPGLRPRLAQVLIELGRKAEAAPHMLEIAEADPSETAQWRRLGRLHADLGDLEAEMGVLRRQIELTGGDVAAHDRLVRLLLELDRKAEAVTHLRVVAEESGGDPDPWRRLTRILGELGQVQTEIEVLQRRLELGDPDPWVLSRLVLVLLRDDRRAEAAPYLRIQAEASPDDPALWRRLTRTLAELGDIPGEIEALMRRVELGQADGEVHARLSRLYAQIDRPEEALAHARAAADAATDPADLHSALSTLTGLVARAGLVEEEVVTLRRRLALGEDAGLHARLAELLPRIDRSSEAIVHLRAFADTAPQPAAWRRLVQALAAAPELEAEIAVQELRVQSGDIEPGTARPQPAPQGEEEAGELAGLWAQAEAAPRQAAPWRRLGLTVAAREGTAGEIRVLQRRLELLGHDDRLHNRLATLLDRVGRQREAAEHLWAVAEAKPQDEHRWRRAIRAMFESGDEAAEAQILNRRLEVLGDEREVHERLALITAKLGRVPEATAHVRAAAAAPPSDDSPARRLLASPHFDSPVLLCGFPHSGTRLLAKLVGAIGVFVVRDTPADEWAYAKWINSVVLPAWMEEPGITGFAAEQAPLAIDPEQIAVRLAEAGYRGDRPWGFKDPRNAVTAEAWMAAFPNARFVNIIRDPMDVLGSMPADKFGRYSPGGVKPQLVLDFWSSLWRTFVARTRGTLARAHAACEVRFEDICADPVATAAVIADRLQLRLPSDRRAIRALRIDRSKVGQHQRMVEQGALPPAEIEALRRLAAEYGYDAPVTGTRPTATTAGR